MALPQAYCHAKLPNAGLGNKLFVWAKAFLFARLNRIPLVVTGWTQFQLAPIIHGGDWRLYWNYFHSVKEIGLVEQTMIRRRAKVVLEPPVAPFELSGQPMVFEFSKIPGWADYFCDLKPHRETVCRGLFEMLTPARRREYEKAERPDICLQIRMGDFRPLGQDENFAKVGNVRTPLEYFINLIGGIRELCGWQVPITIISDGTQNQLQELLRLPAIHLGRRQTAIVDILRMADAKILIPSAGSTFGYWAGFLGEAAIIMHPDHIHQPLRPFSIRETCYEGPAQGPIADWPALLKKNIQALKIH